MMHELLLHAPEGASRPFDEVQAAIRGSETLAPYVNDDASTPEQLVLTDPDTGVWALLAPAAAAESEEEHADDDAAGPLLLQLPYARPRFFAIEGALFAVALRQELGYAIADPQDAAAPGPAPRREEQLVASWEAQNRAILAELEQRPIEVDGPLLDAVFSHNLHRRELRLQAGPAVVVPRLLLAMLAGRREPAVVFRYEAGEPLWMPALATHVVLARQRKGWLGYKDEQRLVEAPALRELLRPFARDGAPAGVEAFEPARDARDPLWQRLEGPDARGLALVDWNDVVDAPR